MSAWWDRSTAPFAQLALQLARTLVEPDFEGRFTSNLQSINVVIHTQHRHERRSNTTRKLRC